MLTRERQRLRIAELPVDHHWIFYRREPLARLLRALPVAIAQSTL